VALARLPPGARRARSPAKAVFGGDIDALEWNIITLLYNVIT